MYYDHGTFGTCHNSGFRGPFDTLTSALDVILRALSLETSFRVNNLPNNTVLEFENRLQMEWKGRGGPGAAAPGRGVWGCVASKTTNKID